jgi:subtilisin family serine protease
MRAATPVLRLQLRADHRRELLDVRRLLPLRLLPGDRGFTAVPPVNETRLVRTEMVFRVGPNASPQALQAAMQRHGLTPISSENMGLAGGTVYHFQVTSGRPVGDVIRAMEAENLGVPSANYMFTLSQEQNEQPAKEEPGSNEQPAAEDPDLAGKNQGGASEQYVVNKLQLAEVHKVATGRGVLVAVVDSAIDMNHPDLAGAFVEQYDAVGRREKPHFHGTGMVGAIAAHHRLMGIAPEARILAIQAFSGTTRQSPEATTKQILAGLDWAVRKGARVINMSFAGPYDPMLALAMKNAHAKGVVLIAASGNLGPKSPPLFPAADPNVIAVTAVDENDRLFAQAVRGPHVAIAAPGVDVMVPAPEETYQLTTGTSVAAAHVSGVAALLIERHPNVDAATILEVLTSTAQKLNPKGRDDQFGWGLIDPASALAELESRMTDNQVASISQPPTQAALPKQVAAPKQQRQGAPRLQPASAQ